jgi:beta-glucosidase
MKIALIGSHVKTPALYGGGSASLKPSYSTTLFDAMSQKLSGTGSEITYSIGAYAHKMLPVMRSLKTLDGIQPGAAMRVFNEDISVTSRKCIAETVIQEVEFQLMDYNPPGLNRELFYAQVDAFFVPDTTGPWTFGLVVCGTGNLFLDDKLIIDNSTTQQSGTTFFGKGTREEKATVHLEAGRQYKIRLDWGSMSTSKLKHVGVISFGGGGARLGACLEIDPVTAVQQAVAVAKAADYVVLCTGLNVGTFHFSPSFLCRSNLKLTSKKGDFESEGYDRVDMNLPPGIDHLISSVLAANPRTVVVTQSGTPISMRWISQAQTLVHAWYGGNETGNGIADILFGDVNPSGKLSLTWPERLEDTPSFLNFGATRGRVLYGEDIYVGYKYYDIMKRGVLFPFG